MSEKLLRNLIALGGTIICALAYLAGYSSGTHGWWWTSVGLLMVYAIIIRLLQH